MTKDPIDRIEWVAAERLEPNLYNPNVVHVQELGLLETSILKTGWVQPILAQRADNVIIDGFHRWTLATKSARLMKRYGGLVPVAFLDVPLAEAMMLTIRVNRANGTHCALRMSAIVHALLNEHGCSAQEIAANIGASHDEVELLAQDGIFKAKKLDKAPYSKAWVPCDKRAKPRAL
jgi:ParB-like chromosome segregation protein Spo0J